MVVPHDEKEKRLKAGRPSVFGNRMWRSDVASNGADIYSDASIRSSAFKATGKGVEPLFT
ncbi:hypothetical protein FF011L_16850 [Roseimaritima multifibrata]|uniref:Uncharacterized protein n=1 Tax=Roseimaritima multifibrata TaxID=1930274 RepID=A0A517MDG0_9BACT|nr:hypothetical protein FF011L_16850 [Roseimaritima multifibrata]